MTYDKDACLAKVREYLKGNPGSTAGEIAEGTEEKVITRTYSALRTLELSGEAVKESRPGIQAKVWTCCPEGTPELTIRMDSGTCSALRALAWRTRRSPEDVALALIRAGLAFREAVK